jgi:hypothetical protein
MRRKERGPAHIADEQGVTREDGVGIAVVFVQITRIKMEVR